MLVYLNTGVSQKFCNILVLHANLPKYEGESKVFNISVESASFPKYEGEVKSFAIFCSMC